MPQPYVTERVMELLRPYAANWSGSLGRGDLVIPQREIPHLVGEIVSVVTDLLAESREATDEELFRALHELERLPSLQDRIARLRAAYKIAKR